ncbi:MAG: glutamine--fructose-6-phosphate transaminase (isomerizing) [Thermodesulfobacteriota bacterium]
MCGIIGYIGKEERTLEVLIEGLKRLEYRGYDSSGIAVLENGHSRVIKSNGKLINLTDKVSRQSISGSIGIGHTRWATHGVPSERNAHPHVSGAISVVHNGIIENYQTLREELKSNGYVFSSETDTEVIAHLIEDYSKNGCTFEESVRNAFKRIVGSYAVAVVSEREPNKIIALRRFSPLIIAIGDDECFIASDIQAILPFSRNVIFLEDGDVAILEGKVFRILDLDGRELKRAISNVNWDPVAIEKCGFRHFMLKEIYEQSRAVLDTMRGRFSEEDGEIYFEGIDGNNFLKNIKRVVALGCGTSYHACQIGKYMIEGLSKIPVEVDLSSEFRYRDPIIDRSTLAIVLSQSGETADTSEALLEAKRKGARTLAITNVFGSKIARESDFVIYTCAGPEIGVASTKAFTTQLIVFYLLSIFIGRHRGSLNESLCKTLIKDAISLPQLLEITFKLDNQIKEIARRFYNYNNFLYLGRGLDYPVALEGALKLKEISYVHAEGFAAGEMKHGPIALVDENMPVVVIATTDGVIYQKILSNLQEIRARRGKVLLFTTEGDNGDLRDQVDELISIPRCNSFMSPIISVVPLQLLAYYIATYKGTDIDQPRNLAKVVTVE